MTTAKWEYTIFTAQGRYPREEEINQLGEKGWELVSSEFIPPNIERGNVATSSLVANEQVVLSADS